VVFLLLVVALSAALNSAKYRTSDALFPALVLAVLLAVGAVLGVLRRYPFGGTPRHQVLILLFAVLAAFVALDRLLQTTRGTGRAALALLCAAAIGASAVVNRDRIRHFGRDEPLNVQAGIYTRELARVRTVHLDVMNFIGLFMDYLGLPLRRTDFREPARRALRAVPGRPQADRNRAPRDLDDGLSRRPALPGAPGIDAVQRMRDGPQRRPESLPRSENGAATERAPGCSGANSGARGRRGSERSLGEVERRLCIRRPLHGALR
jgi:hypothetical protein